MKPIQRLINFGAFCFSLIVAGCGSPEEEVDLAEILIDVGVNPDQAALIILRPEDGAVWSHGGERLDERFVAASTSKIPHTFIALEAGYVEGPDTLFRWDGVERFAESWNQDQTMASAYARSAVWVFQDIASALGTDVMTEGLHMFDYGNQDTGGPDDLTTYWLRGPLTISANEQVQFLSQLYNETFPLSERTYRIGKIIMRANRDDGRFAKTGWYYSESEQDIGWYVGWQIYPTRIADGGSADALLDEEEAQTYIFALNMDINNRDVDISKRVPAVEAALEAISSR